MSRRDVRLFQFPAYDDERGPVEEEGAEIKSRKYLVPENCVLLSKLNPDTPRIWLPRLRMGLRGICSTEFLPFCPTETTSREYLYCLFNSDRFLRGFAGLVTGTSKSHQRVKQKDFLAMQVLLPRKAAIGCWTATAGPQFKRIRTNVSEIGVARHRRDALLPRLLSGDLSVSGQNNLERRRVNA
jgi:type I restriction enzyme S subunit